MSYPFDVPENFRERVVNPYFSNQSRAILNQREEENKTMASLNSISMTPDKVSKLILSSGMNQDDPNATVDVVIHLTGGIIVPIRSIGTDGAGTVYIDADCEELNVKYKED
jgi:16S rRNA C967 or C1407 C5-methylase (RsmB/RsmF family)